MSKWTDALKEWNQGKSGWCIPRKGTAEYDQVIRLMGGPPKRDLSGPKNLFESEFKQMKPKGLALRKPKD